MQYRLAVHFGTLSNYFTNRLDLIKAYDYVNSIILGDPEVTAILYFNFAHPYWECCEICSILKEMKYRFAVNFGTLSTI